MINNSRNIYGDNLSNGIDGHGVDIASQRIDDLDKRVLEYISEQHSPTVLDIGSGGGGQSLRMANLGARVTAVDIHDFSAVYKQFREKNKISLSALNLIKGDVRDIIQLVGGRMFTLGYSQRTLHYLRYDEAHQLLKDLKAIIKEKLFVSVSGIETELGNAYPNRTSLIKSRYSKLSPQMAEKHQIYEPVCLYSMDEFVTSLENSGWKVEESWLSKFGNVKCTCSPK